MQVIHPHPIQGFSILIPSWNNLPYLKLCVESIRKHSTHPHEIILHLNEATDGSLEWAKEQGLKFTFSPENVGVCHALNQASTLATTGFIAFLNDDMYVLPGWDLALWKEIEALPHRMWFLSGTMIEPTFTRNACAIAPNDFGRTVEDFQEERLLNTFRSLPKADWSGATWPPNVVPKELWDHVGGYSEEFSPGMSSDPDFSMKLWKAGVRYFKGIGESRVYHFQAKSTGKVKKNDGKRQFLEKWKMTQSTLFRFYLQRGKPWSGPQKDPGFSLGLMWYRLKSWWKLR